MKNPPTPSIELLTQAQMLIGRIMMNIAMGKPQTVELVEFCAAWSRATTALLEVAEKAEGKVFGIGLSHDGIMISLGDDCAVFEPDKAIRVAEGIIQLAKGKHPISGERIEESPFVTNLGLNASREKN